MERLDQELVNRGLCVSRAQAGRAIKAGYVTVNGAIIAKPAYKVHSDEELSLSDPAAKYVSRAALKLLAIIGDVRGKIAVDLGASTGGFTQVLLEAGARKVFALDVGHNQMHEKLSSDPRVIMREGLNVRDLEKNSIDDPDWPNFEVITADLSFISLQKALPNTIMLSNKNSDLYALVKPQFELKPELIGKKGIVRDPALAESTLHHFSAWLEEKNWSIQQKMPSPILGGDGNQEYLVHARKR